MASNYPAALDTFPTNHIDGEVIDNDTDNDQADALNKIEATLGVSPHAGFSNVATRLGARDIQMVQSVKGYVNHGTNANAARPGGFISVEWFGSISPNNAINGDTWINTA